MNRLGLLLAGLMLCTGVMGAEVGDFDSPAKSTGYVLYAAEQQTVKAGKPSVLELHFKVVDGFHVNSHTPKSTLLIPTQIAIQPATGVKAGVPVYPAGTEFSFSFSPNDKLDVYAGAFTVKVPVTATAGEHTLSGVLRYQACDHASCYPPKTLTVQAPFSAK